MREFFLQLSNGAETEVEGKESPLPCHIHGLAQTASGYGRRLATPYLVRWRNRWRRVYCCQFGNVGTYYIGPAKNWEAVVNIY
jgi:hypothetical protein